MNVSIPLNLLEDIFRLLDYLDDCCGCDDLFFHKAGHSCQLEHNTSLWELKTKITQLQERTLEVYLLSVSNVTVDEIRELREWVDAGKSVYDNPYDLFNESGCPMDFINGCRIGAQMEDMCRNYSDEDPDDWDDELPF